MGQPIQELSPNKIVALGISQVPEGRRIFPRLSVTENLDMGAFLRTDKDGVKKDMDYIFSLFPILAERRAPGRRYAQWRRTADAGHFPRPDGTAATFADG